MAADTSARDADADVTIADRTPPPRVAIPAWLGYVLVFALAVVLRAAYAGAQSLWYDETFTAQIADGRLGDLLGTVADTETTPAFTYVLAWLWAQVAGTGDLALRVPSILFGSLAALVGMRAAAHVAAPRAAVLAGLLLAVNPFAVWYGQEARAYALLELAGAGLLLAVVAWRTNPARGMVLWSAFATLAIVTHYPGWVAAAAALGAVVAVRSAWPRIEVTLTALAVPLLAAAVNAPILVDQQRKGRTSWIGETTLWDRTLQGGRQLMTGLEAPSERALGAVFAVAVLALCAMALRTRRETWVIAAFLGLGAAFLAAGALAGVDIVVARNVIWALPALLVLAASATSATTAAHVATIGTRSRVATGALVVACALVPAWAALSVVVTADADYARPDWSEAISALPKGTEVVFVDPWMQRELVRWYAPEVEPRPLPIAHGDGEVDHAITHEGVLLLGGDVTPAGLPWVRPGSVVTSTGESLVCTTERTDDVVFELRCRP